MNIVDTYNQFADWVAVTIGTLIQLFFAKKPPVRLVILIILSSLVVALYIVMPLVEYTKLNSPRVEAGLYAMSSIVSLAIVRIIINSLPSALKLKAIDLLGIDYDKLRQIEELEKQHKE